MATAARLSLGLWNRLVFTSVFFEHLATEADLVERFLIRSPACLPEKCYTHGTSRNV